MFSYGMINYGRLHKWSLQVRAEKGSKCAICGGEPDGTFWKRIEAHHVSPISSRPDIMYDPRNGIPLCRTCHMKAHGNRQYLPIENYPDEIAAVRECMDSHGWTYPADPPLQVVISK